MRRAPVRVGASRLCASRIRRRACYDSCAPRVSNLCSHASTGPGATRKRRRSEVSSGPGARVHERADAAAAQAHHGNAMDDASAASAAMQPRSAHKSKGGGFQSLGLSPATFSGIMRLGFRVPTPIQRVALPHALAGKDVVAMARTGSGKTAAFVIPMIERLRAHSGKAGVRAIVLSPTRELALQTYKVAKGMGKFTDLRITALVGGESMNEQFAALANRPDVLIATPGRLMHMLLEVPGFGLRSCEYVVFDEADRLFEMGFADQLREILTRMPSARQTMLFSATLPSVLVQFARAGLKDPELIRLDVDTKVSENLRLAFFTVRKEEKAAALVWVARTVIPPEQQALVFVATRHHTELLATLLRESGVSAEPVYGDMDMTARVSNLARFRARKLRMLVCTDVAARGLDLPLLDNVINYDFPDKAKLFVHRCGRVARQGRTGTAFSLLAASDVPYMLDILQFLGKPASNGRHTDATPDAWESHEVAADDEDVDVPDDVYDAAGHDGDDSARPDADGVDVESVASFGAPTTVARMSGGAEHAPALEYTLETMAPSQVHYGQIPRSSMELDIERVRTLLTTRSDCAAWAKSCENAMQLYNKSKAPASRASVLRARGLPHDDVHPLLRQYAVENEDAMRRFISGLQTFRPSQTVFEVDASQRDKATKMMQAKRAAHAGNVAPRFGSVSVAAAAAAAVRGSVDTAEFGAALRASLDAARATSNPETAQAALAAVLRQSSGGDDDDDDADEAGDIEEPAPTQETEIIGADALAELLASRAMPSSLGKRRMSAKERRLAKAGAAAGDGTARPSKQARRASVREAGEDLSSAFRDRAHYIGFTSVGDAATEAALSERGTLASMDGTAAGARGDTLAADLAEAAKLTDSAFDLMPDERGAMETRNRRVRIWDKRKKQYLLVPAEEIVNGKRSRKLATRNESGAVVKQDGKHKYGDLYRKWVRATRRQVGGGDDADEQPATARVVDFGGDEGDDDDAAAAGGGPRGRKRGRFGAGSAVGSPGASGAARKGKHVMSELRSVGQIKKERLRKAKSQGKMRKFTRTPTSSGPKKGAAPSRSKVLRRGGGGGAAKAGRR